MPQAGKARRLITYTLSRTVGDVQTSKLGFGSVEKGGRYAHIKAAYRLVSIAGKSGQKLLHRTSDLSNGRAIEGCT